MTPRNHTLGKMLAGDILKEESVPAPVFTDRVLLVEDDRANALVAGELLQMFGYDFDLVDCGIAALEKIKTNSYSLVLMDLCIAGVDGLEATRQIRAYEAINGRRPVPIIGITASVLRSDRQKCMDAGMNDYISKPYSVEELELKLSRAFAPK